MAHPVQYDQVLCLGDSITQMSWITGGSGAALSDLYQRRLDVVNRGFGGYNSEWAVPVAEQTFPKKEHIGTIYPTIRLLIIWFGANDACLPHSPQSLTIPKFKSNLHHIISLLSSPTSPQYSPRTKYLLVTPPPVNVRMRDADLTTRDPPREPDRTVERTRQFADAVIEVADELEGTLGKDQVGVVDLWTEIDEKAKKAEGGEEEGLKKYLSDGLHLAGHAYAIVFEEMMKTISAKFPELIPDRLPQVWPHWDTIDFENPSKSLIRSK